LICGGFDHRPGCDWLFRVFRPVWQVDLFGRWISYLVAYSSPKLNRVTEPLRASVSEVECWRMTVECF
jgi:hypothetical protein